MNRKISFFLMTFKGFYILQKYLEDFGTTNLDCVIIGRDNRINNDYSKEIIELCQRYNVTYFEHGSDFKLHSEYSISISWRWIISENIKLIILHDSLLPKYRGFAPLVNSLINNEKRIGVTALFAKEEYDKGDIIKQKSIIINYPIKIQEAIELILPLYYDLVKGVVTSIINNLHLESYPQDEAVASYSLWRDEQDYGINWLEDSHFIKRFIDAVGEPYSGASSYLKERKVRILHAFVEKDVNIENRSPGKIIFIKNGEPVVVCGKGLLRIERMIDDDTQKNLIPITKFRVQFR